jgi:DNA polymerase III delta prime subunit
MLPCSAASLKRLAAQAAGGKLFHAYILEGGRGTDKLRAAEYFAKAVHCVGAAPRPCGICLSCVKAAHGNHEDILYLTRDGNSIGVKQTEDLQARLRGKPFASARIVAIVDEAERMTPQSQNKLLKMLEEPAGGNIVLLLTANASLLLGTIQSRCRLLRLAAASDAGPVAFAELAADFAARLAAGSAYYELSRLVSAVTERDDAVDFLEALELDLRDALVAPFGGAQSAAGPADVPRLIDCAEEAGRGLAAGLNVKYTLKAMILKMLS